MARPPAAEPFLQAGRPVLLNDAYQTGSAVAPRRQVDPTTAEKECRGGESQPQYMVFSKSESAHRPQDILTGLAFLRQAGRSTVTLVGIDDAAVWSLFAAAVARVHVNLVADMSNFHGEDQDFIDRIFVPEIQCAGGLKAAQRLAATPHRRDGSE